MVHVDKPRARLSTPGTGKAPFAETGQRPSVGMQRRAPGTCSERPAQTRGRLSSSAPSSNLRRVGQVATHANKHVSPTSRRDVRGKRRSRASQRAGPDWPMKTGRSAAQPNGRLIVGRNCREAFRRYAGSRAGRPHVKSGHGARLGPMRRNHIANRVVLVAGLVLSVARQVLSGLGEFIGHVVAG
jgi:hypothetical protein